MKFNSAHEAFKFVLEQHNIKEIFIPYYLCNVMRHAVFQTKTKLIFYHIDDNFLPQNTFPINAYILYPNYFGICDKNVEKLVSKYPNLIVDNAHAYYAEPSGFASFDSEKKFLPVENGSNLYFRNAKKDVDLDLKRREKFLVWHTKLQAKNCLDIDITENSVPFCYPFLADSIESADVLAKQLQSDGLTIYRYWNPLPPTYNEYKFYSRLVPIPLN